jgi:UDP-3-O-[3-hydroxymyristoyl] glucosamine N-acyltransferase
MITEADLAQATGEKSAERFAVDDLDLISAKGDWSILAFLDDPKFIPALEDNPSVGAVLTTADVAHSLDRSARPVIVVEDPRWSFYTLHNHVAATRPPRAQTVIADDAVIAEGVVISPIGVTIGAGVIIEPTVTILGPARIGAGSIIRAGAVIGSSGFEHKRTRRGILSVVHDGEVTVGERVEIGALTSVAQGFARRPTRIGTESKIDSLVLIAHGTQLGERVFVAGRTVVAGSCTIEDDVWIGPGATIIDQVRIGARSRVGLGSVVLRDVAPDAKVLGNPARLLASAG